MEGKKVCDIVKNETYQKGNNYLNYDGSKLANGSYLCILETLSSRKTVKIIKVK